MLKVGSEGLDLQPRRDRRFLAVFPTNDRREMHWRKQILLDVRQNGVGANLALNIERLVGAGRKRQRQRALSATDNNLRADLIRQLPPHGGRPSLVPSRP